MQQLHRRPQEDRVRGSRTAGDVARPWSEGWDSEGHRRPIQPAPARAGCVEPVADVGSSGTVGRVTRRGHRAPSPRTRVRRIHERGRYDREAIDAVLDAAVVAHLGFVHDGQPFVIPTLHARVGDGVLRPRLSASRAMRTFGGGLPACLTVTLLDGIVLARSVFEHSVNYRSVVVLGQATPVEAPDEKLAALEAFTEKLLPGRWRDARRPTGES